MKGQASTRWTGRALLAALVCAHLGCGPDPAGIDGGATDPPPDGDSGWNPSGDPETWPVEWEHRAIGQGFATGTGLAFAAPDTVIALGYFAGELDLGGTPLVSAGAYDLFFAAYDLRGQMMFTRRLGGPGSEYGVLHLARSTTGTLAMVGAFTGHAELGDIGLDSAGDEDVFVLVTDGNGQPRWARGYGDAAKQRGGDLVVDRDGNLLFSGYVSGGTIDFGGGPLKDPHGCGNVLVKLDPGGQHVWSRMFLGEPANWGTGLATDSQGRLIMVGTARGDVDLGHGMMKGSGHGDADILLASFEPEGTLRWARRLGDGADQEAFAATVDSEDHLLVAGSFSGRLDLGGGVLLSARGAHDGFWARFDQNGQVEQAVQLQGPDDFSVGAVVLDPGGMVLLGGAFAGTLHLGLPSWGEVTAVGPTDGYVARFTADGQLQDFRRFGEPGVMSWVLSVITDPSGAVFYAGGSDPGSAFVGRLTR
jgi:outer membrane protein assembly factor BamB